MNRVHFAVSNFFFFSFTSLYAFMTGPDWIFTLIALTLFVLAFLARQIALTEEVASECIQSLITLGFMLSATTSGLSVQWYANGYTRFDNIPIVCASVNCIACLMSMLYLLCLRRSQDHKLKGKRTHYFLLSFFLQAPYFCFTRLCCSHRCHSRGLCTWALVIFVYIHSVRRGYAVHTDVTQEACAPGHWSSLFTIENVLSVSASGQHGNTWAINVQSPDTTNPIRSQTLNFNTYVRALPPTAPNVKQDSTGRYNDLFSVSSGPQAISREPPDYSDEVSVWLTSSQGNVIYASDVEPLLGEAVNTGGHEATPQEHLVTGTLTSEINVSPMVTRL
ncbi:hypothetical protein BgiBS90_004541 [Biomphalaria glabrata]|nr:hypothetical protein BgiBS90_004541 [Biomphalaria glabrata]